MEQIRPFPTIKSFGNTFYAFFRATLGMLLIFRGIDFIFNLPLLQDMIRNTGYNFNTPVLAYIISCIHLTGGVLIVVGLLTRLAIILQIPIVLAAVLFNMNSATYGTGYQLFLSFSVLVLLIFYLIKGPGKISMDHYRKFFKL